MLIHYEPVVQATIAFLNFLKVKVSDATVNETLQNHPDWPSLLCVSDSLNKWNIPNAAGKIELTEIDQLPVPFVAYTGQIEIVNEVTGKEVKLFSKNKIVNENREAFIKRWRGVYLIAEKTEQSGEPNYERRKRNSFIKHLVPVSLISLLVVTSIIVLCRNMGFSETSSSLFVYLQYLILFAGVVVSSLLLWHEIDGNNPILQKVCTGIVKGNCDAILNGKQSKVFSWLSWSEVGFFYFAGGLITLLFVHPLVQSLAVIAYFNVLALPYTVFSIYYQGRVAKQWCVLCLTVQALLLLGGINVLTSGMLLPLSKLLITSLFSSFILYLLPVLGWYAVKPYLLRLQAAKNTKREYLRIKFNAEIFDALLKKQRQITVPVDGLGIDLGNPAAINTLVKVCNPYCGPCAGAHPKIEKLLEEIPNLKAKIIFTAPNDSTHDAFKPVSHLLAIATHSNKEEVIKKALDDWYLADKKDYAHFATKYPVNGALQEQGDKIEAMHQWCNKMEISYTPTIFVNGYELPAAYSIQDLEYFLLE